ncbi:MAG: OmpA family protein [Balneolaceae bacterium]
MGRSKKDTGNWLMTYSDLVTLLLVFFVLLYVLAPSVDQSVFDNFVSYFQSSSGMMEQPSVISQKSDDIENVQQEINNEWIAVEDYLEVHGLSSQVEIEGTQDGMKITLSDSLTFESGSAELLPAAKIVLGKISEMLDERIAKSEVQGHTDNVPISADFSYRSNWHLGAARAVSVVQFLSDNSELEPKYFKASSFGEFRPILTNETATGRRQNRRVEIYFSYRKLMDLNGIVDPDHYVSFSTINNQ